jgi:hypothetical protein
VGDPHLSASYTVFFSHSMTQNDLAVVYEASRQVAASGVSSYIAERDWQPGVSLPDKVRDEIAKADCLVAFWTEGGSHSAWVNQEIGAAYALGKPIIPIVEKGLSLTGFPTGMEYLPLDREEPQPTFEKLTSYLSRQKLERVTQRAVAAEKRAAVAEQRATQALVIAGAAILVLAIVAILVLQSGALRAGQAKLGPGPGEP